MADRVYLNINGKKQGDIVGESTKKDLERDGSIECWSFEDGVSNPANPSTGRAMGQRAMLPVRIRTGWGLHSVPLAQACRTNESLTCKFRFFRPAEKEDSLTDKEEEHHFYTLTLTDAVITSITRVSPDAEIMGQNKGAAYEVYEFVAKKYDRQYQPEGGGPKEDTDSWSGE